VSRLQPPIYTPADASAKGGELATSAPVTDVPAGPVAPGPARPVAQRFPAFDGLRAIAAVSVVVFHLTRADLRPLNHSYGRYLALLNVGVPLFFVISGFLLYRPFVLAYLTDSPRPATREFLRRRVLRIVPGFWVALTVQCIVFNLDGTPLRDAKWAVVNYGLLQTLVQTAARPGIDVAWTICTEMMFYAFLPLYAVALVSGRARRTSRAQLRRELVGIGLLVVVALGWRWYFLDPHLPRALHWYVFQNNVYLPASTDFFAGGMLLAVLSAWFSLHDEPRWARARALPAVAWGTAFAAYAFYVERVSRWTEPSGRETASARFWHHVLFVVFAVALAVPAALGLQNRGLVRRILSCRPVQIVALGSYGIYLYHFAMIRFLYNVTGAEFGAAGVIFPGRTNFPFVVMAFFTAVLTGACATASYLLVERPFLRWRRPSRHPTRV
jgi:peptidoglycan/LPS O-acetylase OafA/YrhL